MRMTQYLRNLRTKRLVATAFVLDAQHCVARERPPDDLHPSSPVGQTCLLITSTVRDVNREGRGC